MIIIVNGYIMDFPILSKYNLTAQIKERNINYQEKFDDYDIWHYHDYFELFIVLNGAYNHQVNDKKKLVKKGSAFLLRPVDSHKLKSASKNVAHANIMIKNSYFRKCCKEFSPLLYGMIMEKNNIEFYLPDSSINMLMNNLSELYTTENQLKVEFQQKIVMNNILEKIINGCNFISEAMPFWFKEILNIIEKQENLNWTVEDVIKICNYSHTHMERLFKKYTGKTIIQYLTEVKMDYAANFILYSKMKIKEISTLLGYSDVSHFNHNFKKYFNLTPLQYKTTNTKNNNYINSIEITN